MALSPVSVGNSNRPYRYSRQGTIPLAHPLMSLSVTVNTLHERAHLTQSHSGMYDTPIYVFSFA